MPASAAKKAKAKPADPCQVFDDEIQQVTDEIKNFQDALDNGDIPISVVPIVNADIARLRRVTASLRLSLKLCRRKHPGA